MTNNNDSIKYFMYSKTQQDIKKEVTRRIGKNFVPSKVFINGQVFEFTEIVKDPNKTRFSDSKVVASGDINKIKYTIGS